MTLTSHQTSRRSALKFIATAPMLPLGALSAGSLLAGCATSATTSAGMAGVSAAAFASASFVGMAAPSLANPVEMATTSVASRLQVKLQDGSMRDYQLAYQPFFMTGDQVPDGKGGHLLAGGYVNILNKPIIDRSVPGKERQFFSDCPDGTSLLQLPKSTVHGIKGKAVFAVVQFEYTNADQSGAEAYGTLPSPIAVLTLDQDQATGQLSLVKYHNVDTSSVQGLWITCGSSLSPWGTHLSSEEYEPDATSIVGNKQFKAYSKNLFGDENVANPYHYGHLPEVTVHPDGTGSIAKHYCMGRISHELVQVMPDNRTVLMGDDATNSGLFMFVADKEKHLSAGSLYVAKLGGGFSINPSDAGAKVSWIKLGHASSAEIEEMANRLTAADIMTVHTQDPKDAGFTQIHVGGKLNWIKLKPGMEKAAAFLETHRYAALMGASMGFTKMEGTTVNIKDKVAYSALSYIQASMVKGDKAWSAANNTTVDKALVAGGIMAYKLTGGQSDTQGAVMASEWVPTHTQALLMGEDIAPDALGNTGNPDKIANPDNLKFSERLRTLFIGEDTNSHVNNFLWAYNVDTQQLARVASMPAGAEATGLGVIDDMNGWMYITSNFQHPGDWNPKLHGKVQATLDPLVRANYKDRFGAAVGYLTAVPSAVKLG